MIIDERPVRAFTTREVSEFLAVNEADVRNLCRVKVIKNSFQLGESLYLVNDKGIDELRKYLAPKK